MSNKQKNKKRAESEDSFARSKGESYDHDNHDNDQVSQRFAGRDKSPVQVQNPRFLSANKASNSSVKLDKHISRVTKDRENKKMDEKDKVLEKLRQLNFRLRKRLKDLNLKVEKAIEKTDTKRMLASRKKQDVDIPHRIAVKDKELENAQNQLDSYTKEIDNLQKRIDDVSQVDKMLDSEIALKENKAACNELRKQIKDLEK